jgi:hypothetical protein
MSGVYGVADDGTGVTGDGPWAGVRGRSVLGDGVVGECSSTGLKSGVYGVNTGQGYGVFGRGKTGVAGETETGIGVLAQASNYYGTALEVQGAASFSRSGVAAVPKKKSYITITVLSLLQTATCKFLVTMQGSPGAGVFVQYAVKTSATTFRVYFNKKTTKTSKIAWMVVD